MEIEKTGQNTDLTFEVLKNLIINNEGKVTNLMLDSALDKGKITRQQFYELSSGLSRRNEWSNEELEEGRHIDFLTGLRNRRALDQSLPELIRQLDYTGGKKEAAPHSVMVIALDINRFKFVNDTYGHVKGDNALKVVADRFRQVTKEWSGQQVFRYGGDEFIIVLPIKKDLNQGEMEEIFQRIQAKINNDLSISVNDNKFFLTLSMAFSSYKK